jgi:predicted MFS family arabinose efflux permease
MGRSPSGAGRLRSVLATPGAVPLLAARSFGAAPMGMIPLGIVLLLRAAGRSYALAGVADGAYALGFAVASPLLGRLIDRVGMSRVLAPLAVLFPSLVVALTLVGRSGASGGATIGLALASGAAMPPVGACMRALWPTLVPPGERRVAAFALDAILQELAFVGGPPLLAGVTALAGPATAMFVAGGLGAGGTIVFALRAHTRHAPEPRTRGALRSAGVRRLLAMNFILGGAFGSFEVAMPAFCERHGSRPAAGIILATAAIGSITGGVVFGSRTARVTLVRRLEYSLAAYAVVLTPLLVAPSIPAMALLGLLAGAPVAPAFAGFYLLLDRFSVPGAITETFAWNTTVIFVGASIGTAVGGALIASSGYRPAIVFAIACAGGCALLVGGYERLGRLDGADH